MKSSLSFVKKVESKKIRDMFSLAYFVNTKYLNKQSLIIKKNIKKKKKKKKKKTYFQKEILFKYKKLFITYMKNLKLQYTIYTFVRYS